MICSIRQIFFGLYQHRDQFNNQGHYTVVFVGSLSIEDQFDLSHEIFSAFWADSATNILFLTSDEHRTTLYTYIVYSNESCGSPITVAHNYFWHTGDNNTNTLEEGFNTGFEFDRPFFPKKCANLFNCPINVGTFEFPPFMILSQRETENGTNETYFDGIEGIVVRVLSQRLHFTPILVLPEDKERWGSCDKEMVNCNGSLKLVGNNSL